MADFDVSLSKLGIQFVPASANATEWLQRSGRAKELSGPDQALIRDNQSVARLYDTLYRAGLTWNEKISLTRTKPLIPTYEAYDRYKRSRSISSILPRGLDAIERFFHSGLGAGLSLLAILACAGTMAFGIVMDGRQASEPSKPAKPQSMMQQLETQVVTECDLAIKSSLIAQDSYDPEFQWRYIDGGNNAEVLRHYDSTNGFGGKVTSIYDCKYDGVKKRIVSLQTASPYGATTIIADPSDTPVEHAHSHRHRHHDK